MGEQALAWAPNRALTFSKEPMIRSPAPRTSRCRTVNIESGAAFPTMPPPLGYRPLAALGFARTGLSCLVAFWACLGALPGLVAQSPTGSSPAGLGAPSNSTGPASATEPAPAPVFTINANLYTSMEALDDRQKLGMGDRLSYRVLEDREEAKALIVTDSGELEIPYLGRVKADDKTCKELAHEVKAALEKDLYYQATVILAIDQLNRKRGSVYLVGQVKAAGALEIPSDEVFTLSKAILRAGGFGDFADKKRVRLTRKAAEENKIFVVDVGEIFEKGRTENDVKLEPGDLIFVPSRLINF